MIDFINTYIGIPVAYAQSTTTVEVLMARINKFVLNPIITVVFILAFLIFMWGLFQFYQEQNGGQKEGGLENAKRHIIWGIIGMVIMVSVFSIIQLIINTLGVEGIQPNSPNVNLVLKLLNFS